MILLQEDSCTLFFHFCVSVTYHNVLNILFTSIVNARKSKLKKEEGVYLRFETDRSAFRDSQLKEFSFDLLKKR